MRRQIKILKKQNIVHTKVKFPFSDDKTIPDSFKADVIMFKNTKDEVNYYFFLEKNNTPIKLEKRGDTFVWDESHQGEEYTYTLVTKDGNKTFNLVIRKKWYDLHFEPDEIRDGWWLTATLAGPKNSLIPIYIQKNISSFNELLTDKDIIEKTKKTIEKMGYKLLGYCSPSGLWIKF